MKSPGIVFVFLLAGVAVPIPILARKLTLTNARIQFTSRTPIESFTGRTTKAEGEIDVESRKVRVKVDLASLSTGLRRRDEHMRENELETDKYPFAEFSGVVAPNAESGTTARADGSLTVHGVSKNVTMSGSLEKIKGGWRLKCAFPVRLADFKIPIPRFLVMKIAEEVQVETELEFTEVP